MEYLVMTLQLAVLLRCGSLLSAFYDFERTCFRTFILLPLCLSFLLVCPLYFLLSLHTFVFPVTIFSSLAQSV
jgi:hypothetical protein